jgi:hypothetical protein
MKLDYMECIANCRTNKYNSFVSLVKGIAQARSGHTGNVTGRHLAFKKGVPE